MPNKPADDAIQAALKHHRRGELRQAESIYRQVLQADPSNPDALNLLGVIAYQEGKHDEAVRLIKQAITANPGVPDFYNNLGNALRLLARVDEAISAFQQALSLAPRFAEALNNLALAFRDGGRSEEAVRSARKALKINPELPDANNTLGMALLDQGKNDEAIRCFRQAVRLKPDYAEAFNNLGLALKAQGKAEDALRCYLDALRLNPSLAQAHNNLGTIHREAGRYHDAAACYLEALRLNPLMTEAHSNLGALRHEEGLLREAAGHYERALGLKPDSTLALWGRCMAQLEILHDTPGDIPASRERYRKMLEGLREAIRLDNPARILNAAKAVGGAQPFYLAYQGEVDRELQSLYGELVCRIQSAKFPQWSKPRPLPGAAAGERLRVGIVSGYFYYHSNWKIPIKGWVENLDPRRFALYAYHTGRRKDAETRVARKSFVRFVDDQFSIEQLCRSILDDRLHVLIYPEVGMDPATVQLAALRLAPVQCASWGHPNTTGLHTLDYFLSSDLMEPPDGEDHYCEKLVRLPNLSIHYTPTEIQPAAVDRAHFGLREGSLVYFCAQSLFKYLPQHDEIFPRIAEQAGACRFVFLEYGRCREINQRFLSRLKRAFALHGLRVEDYVVLLPPQAPPHYQALNRLIDVFLDSMEWSGCNSTLEAINYGRPVVTLPGRLMRGRHSFAILTMMGVTDTIATSIDDYVRIAARLGKDAGWRDQMTEKMRANASKVYRDMESIRGLEKFLEQAAAGGAAQK
jgi:predicted O-linked N-acetylglucosamine transferase (SPINDLY family)